MDTRQDNNTHGHSNPYWRFMAMIAAGTVVMFGMMYLNTYRLDHVFWSETRFWMAFVMGAGMMVVMLAFMWGMYPSRAKNLVILAVAAAVFAGGLWLVRSQRTVTDTEYMRAMIPHHSIAILTSTRAQLRDPRVRELAATIAETQRREIAEMRALIEDIEANGVRPDRIAGARAQLTPKPSTRARPASGPPSPRR
jgi:hypothetical protein